jgi:very-short-patch-repair endonuclease
MNIEVKTSDYVIKLARDMRNNMTDAEKILWAKLRNRKLSGYKFRSQHPIYRYILDFYCHEKLLAIEIDGDIHKDRKNYDEYRDEFMKSLDIKTLRFHNHEVLHNIDSVLQKIQNELN